MKLKILLSFFLILYPCIVLADPDPVSYEMYGFTIPGMITYQTWQTPPPIYFSTRALWQRDGLLEETARTHGYDGTEEYVALISPSTAGWKVWLKPPNASTWIPARVVDYARREHAWFHSIPQHSGIEISGRLAEEWGVEQMRDPRGAYMWGLLVCVTDYDPDAVCTGTPVDYERWFASIATFEG